MQVSTWAEIENVDVQAYRKDDITIYFRSKNEFISLMMSAHSHEEAVQLSGILEKAAAEFRRAWREASDS